MVILSLFICHSNKTVRSILQCFQKNILHCYHHKYCIASTKILHCYQKIYCIVATKYTTLFPPKYCIVSNKNTALFPPQYYIVFPKILHYFHQNTALFPPKYCIISTKLLHNDCFHKYTALLLTKYTALFHRKMLHCSYQYAASFSPKIASTKYTAASSPHMLHCLNNNIMHYLHKIYCIVST